MSIKLSASRDGVARPLVHFWSTCVGAGRANEGLRAGWQEQLREAVGQCGFRYLRFHGLFHDDMFVYRESNGKAVCNFQYIDELFDRMLAIGIRPFVELGFCPSDLASQTGTVFWWKGNGAPPKDYEKWGELVGRFTRHVVDRYGAQEVRKWYFEVWNEPNLHPFFRGTRSQYFELYRSSVRAVKQVDAQLRVGGPATSNFVPDARFAGETEDFSQHGVVTRAKDLDALEWRPVWVEEFLKFCHREQLPVDFVSCHPYPTDWALDEMGQSVKSTRGVNATMKDLACIRQAVAASAYAGAEIHLTEWNSSPSPRDYTHDYLQAATFVVKCNLEGAGLVDSLSYWTFTDVFEEGGAGDTLFHGGFGMINYQGIVKPTFHAYRMLNQLGDQLLYQRPGGVVTRHSATGRVTALAYHYSAEMPLSAPASFGTRETAENTLARGSAAELELDVRGLAAHAGFVVETLGKLHGNVMAAWQAMGAPETPTREQQRELREQALRTSRQIIRADAEGRLGVRCRLEPWSVVLINQL